MTSYLDWLSNMEGFSAKPYWDHKQWSVGRGTRAAGPDDVVDEAEANRRLAAEAKKAFDAVDARFPNLDAGTRAAMGDLTFNAGSGWMNDGLGRAVANGDLDSARRIYRQYNHAGGVENEGLTARRNQGASWIGGQGPDTAPFQMADATQRSPVEGSGAASVTTVTTPTPNSTPPSGAALAAIVGPFLQSPSDAPASKDFGKTFGENFAASMTENANRAKPQDTRLLQQAIEAEAERRKKFALSPFDFARVG